jgi:hypothetical protein
MVYSQEEYQHDREILISALTARIKASAGNNKELKKCSNQVDMIDDVIL